MQKIWNTLKTFIVFLFPIWLIIYFWPNKKKDPMPFFNQLNEKPLNIAHRGGAALAPEETLEAFTKSILAGADMFEYDVHITKDGYLIASHDPTVDRITNGTGIINELTLEEIKTFDAGAKFMDNDGKTPFLNKGVKLATVEEIFQLFPDVPAVIELKDDNDPKLYDAMIEEMWRLIQLYNMEDKVIIASFDHQINRRFKRLSKSTVAIGAGQSAATSYIVPLLLGLKGLATTDAQSFQLPISQFGIDMTSKQIVNTNKKRGIDTYYWTINVEETMRTLIAKNVDGIMTDDPELLEKVMIEEGRR